MFKALTSKLFSLGQGLLRTSTSITNNVISEPLVRTRTTCSKLGKEKSVKTAMHRYFRVNKRIWIRAIPGFQSKLYRKTLEERFLLQQPVLISKKESRMVERMSGPYFKKLKLEEFTHGPLANYQSLLKRTQHKFHELNKGKVFYP